jgi:glycosyltransferase involved in cell wall biosynthesis
MSTREHIINIISNSAKFNVGRGPRKVFENACKGFELIGQPYVVNRSLSDYSWNWIHDSLEGLLEVSVLGKPAVLGPNIVVLPKDLPKFRPQLKNCIYLHPCEWAVGVWQQLGFTECQLLAWSVGIDYESFDVSRKNVINDQVMVYYKQRDPILLTEVLRVIKKNNLTPVVITYGEYTEEQYLEALSKSSFGVWLGCHESQGIALQEALAAGLPLIVIDAKSLFDAYAQNTYDFPSILKSFRTTSAPYFDPRCGLIIDGIDELDWAINEVKDGFNNLNPKEYIKETLSLEISARKLVNIFSHLRVDDRMTNKHKEIVGKPFSVSLMTKALLRIHHTHGLLKNIL